MSYSIEKINESEHIVNFNVDASEVNKVYTAAYKEIASKARINGFRKGHVPTNILLKEYGGEIDNRTFSNLYTNCMKALAKDFPVQIIDAKNVRNQNQLVRSKSFSFTVTIITVPLFEERDISDVKAELVDCKISEADVDTMIDILRKQSATYEELEGDSAVVAEDSIANIDFVGKGEDGVAFDGGTAKGYDVDISAKRMIPGFCEQLVGHKKGEEFTINCQFPEDYHVDELKGKKCTFDITVNSVKTRKLPELNDDFAKQLEVENVDALRQSLKKNLIRQAENIVENTNFEKVILAISEKYKDVAIDERVYMDAAQRLYFSALVRAFQGNEKIAEEFLKRAGEDGIKNFYDNETEKVQSYALTENLIEFYEKVLKLKEQPVEDTFNKIIETESSAFDDPEEFKVEANKKDGDLYKKFLRKAYNSILFDLLKSKIQVTTKEITWDELNKRIQG